MSECCLISYFDARRFWCIFVHAILKTRFLTTCISATSFKIWTFSAFMYFSETTRTIFFTSLHIIFIMYIIMSETFIKIDSLQHLEISRQTYSIRTSQKSALQQALFWGYASFSGQYLYPWLVHFSVSIVNVFIQKMRWIQIKMYYHGGMYGTHYFGKISITTKQWKLLVKIL